MNSRVERKTHASDICIDGKRITAMREIALATFGESFMFIEVDVVERIFVLRIDDGVGNGVDISKLLKFQDKYRLCKVKVYQEIDQALLKIRRQEK